MTPVTKAKWAVFAEYKWTPIEGNLQILKSARSKAQHTADSVPVSIEQIVSQAIQTAAAASGDIRRMYNGIKNSTATNPKQNSRSEIYHRGSKNRPSSSDELAFRALLGRKWVTPSVRDNIECLPLMAELNAVLTEDEHNKTIDSLASEKSFWY